MRKSFTHLLSASLLLALCATARADKALVIEGARIVPGDGPVIEKGAVVIEGDKIVHVGADVQKPADAQVIDGKGLTVYPGLIDTYCLAGVPAPPSPPPAQSANTGGGQGGQRRGQGRQGGGGQSGFTPPPAAPLVWRKATEGLNAKSSALPGLRNNGYTTALLCPRGVLTPGEAVLVGLSGDGPAVLQDRAAVNINMLSRGGGSYPTTLMGAIGFLRQSFYDGVDYGSRPHDKTDARLDGLAVASQGKIPVFCTANSENDIKRALRLRDEFKLKLYVLGGREAEKVAGALAERKVPVVLTDDWTQAVALQKAGVRFALTSNSIEMTSSDADDLRSKALKLVEKGMAADLVLAALTRTPAELLGVADKLGTVAPGKLANLVITEGDLFSKDGKVKFVVVKGQKIDPTPMKAETGPRPLRVASDGEPYRNVTEDDADGDGGTK